MVKQTTAGRSLVTWLAILATVALSWVACDNDVDRPLNKLPVAAADTTSDVEDVQPAGTCDCLAVGDWYRFSKLELLTIAGEPNNLLSILNGLWAKDIENLELNIMVEVVSFTLDELELRVVSAARVFGTDELCLLPDASAQFIHPRAGCAMGASAPSGLNVFAGTTQRVKNCAPGLTPLHAIPARSVVVEGRLADDCSGILGGQVPSAVISEAGLGAVCSCVLASTEECGDIDPAYDKVPECAGCSSKFSNLKNLLATLGGITRYDCQDAAGEPAVCVTAQFEAVAYDATPAPCP